MHDRPALHRPSGTVTPPLSQPLGRFLALAGLGAAGLVVAMVAGGTDALALALTLALYVAAIALTARDLARSYPHPVLGLCNAVTLARLVLVAGLWAMILNGHPPGWPSLALATLALSLDGADGWLARRQGLSSEFGARFDVEVDAALALTLALHAAVGGAVSPLILLLGLPYYLFRLAQRAWGWLGGPLPPSLLRKAICVAQIATLIAAQIPGLPIAVLNATIAGVTLALAWSFGRDILHLWRNRP